ncbi:hypothetical protein ACO0LO_01750 [Undibacterium sp. TJN25]|uniref:hypothetical protein n=1 Tax=Undibacterium sp. TJN25 TaxID=3413056 RepID=UPI003BEFD969
MTKLVFANGNAYSDDGTSGHDMRTGGFRDNLMPMIADIMGEAGDKLAAAAAQAVLATQQASLAQASAATAVTAPGTVASSETQLTIGIDVQNLMVEPHKSIAIGAWYVIACTATPQIQMAGPVKAYNEATGALQIGTTVSKGNGTFSAWTVSLSAPIPSLSSFVSSIPPGYNITSSDQGNVLKYTAAVPGTLTAASVVALGSGFSGWIRATRSSLTLDPFSSELVNGAASFVIRPGELWYYSVTNGAFTLELVEASATAAVLQINTNQVLGAASARILNFTPTVPNLSVTMADATTEPVGSQVRVVQNSGLVDLTLRNAAGALLATVQPGGIANLALSDNSTANGNWKPWGQGLSPLAWPRVNSSVGGAAVTTKAVLKLSPTLAVFITQGPANVFATAYDLSTDNLGLPTSLGNLGAFVNAQVITANSAMICGAGPVNSIVAFTVSGVLVSPGAPANASPVGSPAGCLVLSPTQAVVWSGTSNTLPVLGLTITGNALAIGNVTTNALGTNASVTFVPAMAIAVSATVAMFPAQDTNGAARVGIVSFSGTAQPTFIAWTALTTTSNFNGISNLLASPAGVANEWWYLDNTLAPTQLRKVSWNGSAFAVSSVATATATFAAVGTITKYGTSVLLTPTTTAGNFFDVYKADAGGFTKLTDAAASSLNAQGSVGGGLNFNYLAIGTAGVTAFDLVNKVPRALMPFAGAAAVFSNGSKDYLVGLQPGAIGAAVDNSSTAAAPSIPASFAIPNIGSLVSANMAQVFGNKAVMLNASGYMSVMEMA